MFERVLTLESYYADRQQKLFKSNEIFSVMFVLLGFFKLPFKKMIFISLNMLTCNTEEKGELQKLYLNIS